MTGAGLRARAMLYGFFYRIPARWRRRLVRVATAKFIIGGVMLVADADDPQRLLLLRQPPGRRWSLPAGLLKRREKPVVGAARELFEETGIRVAVEEVRPATPSAVVHANGRWVDMVFRVSVPGDVPLVVDGAEVFEAKWYRLDELPPLTTATAKLLAHFDIGPYADDPVVRAGD